jgi:hypothetical protein
MSPIQTAYSGLWRGTSSVASPVDSLMTPTQPGSATPNAHWKNAYDVGNKE